MASGAPPAAVLNEFLGATTRHTRRVEIYESDGITRWAKDTSVRLKGGSVSVDYDRDERRSLDLTLSNDDGALVNAPGEFWYDKIIKVFRGVRVNAAAPLPRIIIISDHSDPGTSQAPALRNALTELGFGDVQINTFATSYADDLAEFDIIISIGNVDKGALLNQAYAAGKTVLAVRGAAEFFYNALMGGTTWAGTSSTLPGAWTEVRRNRVKNPNLASTNSWFANAGTGATKADSRPTTGGPTNGAFFRVTFSIANTTAVGTGSQSSIVYDGRGTAPLPAPVTPGQTYSAAIYARTSIAQYLDCRIQWYDASNVALTGGAAQTAGPGVTVAANTWERLTVEGAVAPAGAAYARVAAFAPSGTDAVPFPVNSTFDATMAQLELTTTEIGPYFDGATTSTTPELAYAWTGTAHASESTLSSFAATDDISALRVNDVRTVGWAPFMPRAAATAYKAPDISVPGIFGVAYHPGVETSYSITSGTNNVNGKFIAIHYPISPNQYQESDFRGFLLAAMNWLNPIVPLTEWETQIGEFMIDRISEPHFPREMKITGRDYTKKCLLAKFAEATAFGAGNSLESVITAISSGAGITKRMFPQTGIVIGREFFFERNTSRWEAMKKICTSYKYEIFFDAAGYLVIRPFRDPTTTAPMLYLETHNESANVVTYSKSTSDTQIFNHIVVSGENSDADTLPVWAQVKNINPYSPTSIDNLGPRYWEYVSEFIETEEQAQELADAYLSIKSLEEFELSFDALLLPWLEVGDILGFVDPRRAPDDPLTFLLSSITLPLELAPMGGSARRITVITETQIPGLTSASTWNSLPDNVTWNQLPANQTWEDI